MGNFRFDKLRTVFAAPDARARESLHQTFSWHGMAESRQAGSLEEIHNTLVGSDVDLLVASFDMGGPDVSAFIHDVRHGLIGDNPFVVIVALLESPDSLTVGKALASATDDLIIAPLQPKQLFQRLDSFVSARKPFMITHDYVGPDRRGEGMANRTDASTMEVPNPVRSQVVANPTGKSLREQITEASMRLNMHKIKSYGGHVCTLADRVARNYMRTGQQSALLADVTQLDMAGRDLARRVEGTTLAEAQELVASLSLLCQRIATPGRVPKPAEINILPTLTRTVQRMLEEDPSAMSWAATAIQFKELLSA